MKKILAALLRFSRGTIRHREALHDDTLRANQGDRSPAFSFWRALVG